MSVIKEALIAQLPYAAECPALGSPRPTRFNGHAVTPSERLRQSNLRSSLKTSSGVPSCSIFTHLESLLVRLAAPKLADSADAAGTIC